MNDLISRQAAIDACHNYEDGKDAYAYGDVVEKRLKTLPYAQPIEAEPVKHGKWVPVTNGRGGFECSVCTNYAPSYLDGVEWLSGFCPTCGAKMDEVENG